MYGHYSLPDVPRRTEVQRWTRATDNFRGTERLPLVRPELQPHDPPYQQKYLDLGSGTTDVALAMRSMQLPGFHILDSTAGIDVYHSLSSLLSQLLVEHKVGHFTSLASCEAILGRHAHP